MDEKTLVDLINALKVGEVLRLENVPEELYHSAPGIGSTAMKQAVISMAHYQTYIKKDTEISKSLEACFRLGSAVHAKTLEPHVYLQNYVSMPEGMRRIGEKWTNFKAANEGAEILSFKEFNDVKAMAESLCEMTKSFMESKSARLLDGGITEVSYWRRHKTGLFLKARIDCERGAVKIDVKTTRDASPAKLYKTVKYDYGVQSGLYTMITDADAFVFIGVDKKAPFGKSIIEQGQDVIDENIELIEEALRNIALCEKTGVWPCYSEEVQVTKLTEWEKK